MVLKTIALPLRHTVFTIFFNICTICINEQNLIIFYIFYFFPIFYLFLNKINNIICICSCILFKSLILRLYIRVSILIYGFLYQILLFSMDGLYLVFNTLYTWFHIIYRAKETLHVIFPVCTTFVILVDYLAIGICVVEIVINFLYLLYSFFKKLIKELIYSRVY